MSFKAVAQAVADRKQDEFLEGTVVRWTMKYDGSDTGYLYTAVKTAAGWYTSAKPGGSVPQVLSFKGLLSILGSPEASDVAIATRWLDPAVFNNDVNEADRASVTRAPVDVANLRGLIIRQAASLATSGEQSGPLTLTFLEGQLDRAVRSILDELGVNAE